MDLDVAKLHGLGNDYLFVDDPGGILDDPAALAVRLSHRHHGLGADGLIVVRPSERADARMVMFNADGSRGRMCGNGLRCLAKFLFDAGRVGDHLALESDAGISEAEIRATFPDGKARTIAVEMPVPDLDPGGNDPSGSLLRLTTPFGDLVAVAVNVGNPHCVVLDPPLGDDLSVEWIGRWLQQHERFANGVNVEFVRKESRDLLTQRTFERGSGETLACGSGACAAAAVGMTHLDMSSPLTVSLKGGDLAIEWEGPGKRIRQIGPAVLVYQARIAFAASH
jgi:diaminopimelate epimerase